MKESKFIEIHEAQKITGLSDSCILWLIKEKLLDLRIDSAGALKVSVASLTDANLIQSLIQSGQTPLINQKEVIKERLAVIIADRLQQTLDEAVATLLK